MTALIVTISLAFIGYLATYVINVRVAQRRDRLDLVTKRLSDFYGPLYIASQAGEIMYRTFLAKMHEAKALQPGVTPNAQELFLDHSTLPPEEFAEWRLWQETIFSRIDAAREKIILENAYLITEPGTPQCLLNFVAHASANEAMRQKWADGDLREQEPAVPFPRDLLSYVEERYTELKAEQLELLGREARRLRLRGRRGGG
jgi:hypothetical protein